MAGELPITAPGGTPELQGNTEFGEEVVAATDQPAAPIHVGGVPLDEYVTRRREGESDDPQPSLFRPEVTTSLFGKPELDDQQPMANGTATNKAYNESIINDDPEGFEDRKQAHLQADNVTDATLELLQREVTAGRLLDSGKLTDEFQAGLTPVERIQSLQTEIQRLDMRELTPTNVMLIEAFAAGYGTVRMETFQSYARKTPVAQIHNAMEQRVASSRRKARHEVDEVVASQGWDHVGQALAEVVVQDLTPLFPLLSRWRIVDGLTDAAGVPRAGGMKGWLLGEMRQNLREGLYAMNSDEFLEAARAMKNQIREWERDPVMADLVTRYAVLEQYEAVFTEDVFDGKSARNSGDRWFGNIETFLEAIFSVVVVAKGAKGIFRTFAATDRISSKTLAEAAGAPEVSAKIDDMVQHDELAVAFDLDADAAVPAMLPRPIRFADDVEQLPDGTKDVVVRNERIREEILEDTEELTGLGLTKADKTNAVNAEITALDLADGAHVQGRMSTLGMLGDDVGFRMRVVVGESAEGGYKSIDDALNELKNIDPDGAAGVTLMRVNSEGVLEPIFDSVEDFQRALFKGEVDPSTAGRIAGGDTLDETFYLSYDKDQFWHTVDKEAFGGTSFLSGGIVPRFALAPNAKFGDEIYGSFLRAYMGEQKILKNFENLFKPYYDMGRADKKFVASVYEYMEDFGKNHGRAPTSSEIMAKYDGITEAQMSGITALRDGMDTMHELFNRRLYRDWNALGYKTAKPLNSDLPTFHGNVLERNAAGGGKVLDPDTGKMVSMSARELDDLYNAGGRVMELDMAVDAANEAGHKATKILVREDAYRVGDLSTKPLKYHPGYSMRFYDDPYYIVKETSGVSINGSVRAGNASTSSDALRTAGTQGEAEDFMAKMVRSDEERGVQGTTYRVVRSNNISQTEANLFQKQSIHREGRLFWDDRNFDRLPDVNGNRAKLEDPVRSLERGIGQAARQLTHEDLLKGIKNAWKNDYGHMIDPDLLTRFDLSEISRRLKNIARETLDKGDKARVKQARELIDYMRLIDGTEQTIVPALREAALSVATTVNKVTGAKAKGIEQFAMTVDPLRAMRSTAFNLFMVFRPVRQAILQGSQIGFLAALSPRYVASVQFFKDAKALNRGLVMLRKSGYDDGFSVAAMAKTMGMTQKEYRVLIRNFDRSGLVDLVDVHSFAGGSGKFKKTPTESIAGTIGYRAKQATRATTGGLQSVGFNLGEKANLTFTYNLARKRLMDRKGYKSVLDLTKKDWDDLRVDASNLALGMVKPNAFGYQTGALSVGTQFLAFGHKAALGLLAANPAISKLDALKIVGGTYMLYGANMYGARDMVEEQLGKIGVPNQPIPGTNFDLVDLLSGGLIDSTFNMLGDLTVEDWKDIDLGFLAPGVDFTRLWEMNLETLMSQPLKAAIGPFGNIASKTLTSMNFVYRVHQGNPDLPADEKFTVTANAMLSGIFPVYNDAMQSYIGYQMDQWYSTSGEPLPLEPTMNGLIARSLMGGRTREELQYYRLQNRLWEDKATYNSIRDANREYFRKLATALGQSQMTEAEVYRQIDALVNVFEEWPEAVRLQLFKDSMGELKRNDQLIPSVYQTLVEALQNKRSDPALINDYIDRFPNIPADKREQLRDLATEAHKSRVFVDDTALEELKEGQE
jgi:hypothetical protein